MIRPFRQGTVILAAVLLFSYLTAEVRILPELTVISPCYLKADPLHPGTAREFETRIRWQQQAGKIPFYFSHRGDSVDHVEHTFAAYDAAIQKGSRCIEQDLVLSASGTLYVSHDDNARRLTGINRLYSTMTDQEIAALRMENGEPVHSLQEVFSRYGTDVTYVVEVRPVEAEVLKFIEIVKQDGLEDNIIMQCKDLQLIHQIRQTFPSMPVLFLAMNLQDVSQGLTDPDVDIISVPRKWTSEEMAEWIHSYEKLYSVWTLDTEEEMEAAHACGVDIFFTDDTGLAAAMTRSWRT